MSGSLIGGMSRILPIIEWGGNYRRSDIRGDLAAGLTIGAMLVPQAMAYALLAGLPPEVGLYASTVPLIAYALFGTSRQLAVGPVALVSLITAATLAPIVDEGSAPYLAAAAVLALLVGVVHLVLALGRLGFVVNFLSHSGGRSPRGAWSCAARFTTSSRASSFPSMTPRGREADSLIRSASP